MANNAAARSLHLDERGAIAIVVLFMAVFLVAALFYLIDIGSALLYRERMQDAADAAAFSSAVMHARGMNILALINMIMAALLAILVALNLIELLVVVGMAALAACAAFPPTAVACALALTELNTVRNTVSSIRDTVRESVLSGLSMLHTAERGVRLFIPYASELAVIRSVDGYYSPPVNLGFAIPPRAALPTVNDTYTELCGRAGDDVAKLVIWPFDNAGVPSFVTDAAKSALDALVASNPKWFCAGTGASDAARTFDQKYDQAFPSTPKDAACSAAEPLSDEAQALCGAAADEAARAMPDQVTGECGVGCDRSLYDRRAKNARVECDPNQHPARRKYAWQERTVVKHYQSTRAGLQWLAGADDAGPPRYRDDKQAPCPRGSGRDASIAWNVDWPSAPGQTPEPVCSFVTDGAGSETQTVTEVLQVFHCQEKVTRKRKINDLSRDSDLGAHDANDTSRVPQKMEPGLGFGDDAFQIRAVVLGQEPASYEGIVSVAAWGKAPTEVVLSLPAAFGRVQVAQAEYYFGGKASDPRDWLWSMDWKARLHRFRLPSNADKPSASTTAATDTTALDTDDAAFDIPTPSLDFGTGCANAQHDGPAAKADGAECTDLGTKLESLGQLIVH